MRSMTFTVNSESRVFLRANSSDQRERATSNRAAARSWLAALPPYKVIDGTSLDEAKLRLAPGSDTRKWRLRLDRAKGDVMLTFTP